MTPERWQQIRDVLEKALELTPDDRSAFLNRACSTDPSLRREIDTLLASSEDVRSSFLKSPPPRVVLTPGAKLGEYEIKSLLGSGGMGEVYRARDTRLGRDVAIKVLPAVFSSDADRLHRFEQEARAAAALNHPNILAVFQMGTYEGVPYLVTELLDGETLREQLKRGKLAVRKAIDYGVQVARGLSAAHERGIVHRDLKPENLFVTKDGRVKILDFGLAKLTRPQPGFEHSAPTVGSGETEPGAVMGTVGYMSPEQVRGQNADHRTDIFSFGAILYEMLAGKRAFQKPTSAETMSAILNEDPPSISQVTTSIPPALQRVVHRCLEKNPEQRFQSASDLAFALDALSETLASRAPLPTAGFRHRSKIWAIAALLVLAAGVVLAVQLRYRWAHEQRHQTVERQLTANPPESTISSAAISRDGKYLAYTGYGEFSNKLYLLAVDSGEVRNVPLPARYQVSDWFADGNHVLLSGGATGGVWKVSTWDFSRRKLWSGISDGQAVSPDGSQVAFTTERDKELWVMGSDGEEPRKVLVTDSQEWISSSAWSPNGRRIAFVRWTGPRLNPKATIETCDLTGGSRTQVLSDPHLLGSDGISGLSWLADGRLIYTIYEETSEGLDGNLWAIAISPTTGEPVGRATKVVGWRNFRAESPQANADGKRLIVTKLHIRTPIYIGELASRDKTFTPRMLTVDEWQDVVNAWTNDSKAVLFHSKRSGRWAIFKQDIDANTPESLIAGSESYFSPYPSAEGMLLYTATSAIDRFEPDDKSIRLMSTSLKGGSRSLLMMGRYVYACAASSGSPCVVSELKDRHLTFSRLDPLRGKQEQLARVDDFNYPSNCWGCWSLSPDGSRIAVVDPMKEKGEVQLINLASREMTPLPIRGWRWRFFDTIAWAADGKSLFATVPDVSNYDLLSIDANGSPQVLLEYPIGAAFISSLVPSPDGRFLAYSKRIYVSDVMLLEKF